MIPQLSHSSSDVSQSPDTTPEAAPCAAAPCSAERRSIHVTEIVYAVFVLAAGVLLLATAV